MERCRVRMQLDLPERNYLSSSKNDYGAERVLSEYLGLRKTGFLFGNWQHAWIGPHRNIHPELVISENGRSRKKKGYSRFFVARTDQVEYLRSVGYRLVEAIGHPLVYLSDGVYDRIPNSLLVMPMHSLPQNNECWLDEGRKYVEYLSTLRDKFEFICACVHPTCVKKGFWIDDFQKNGIHVVEGADPRDSNSLVRLQALFSQFEFVTANGHGSPIAYASFFGAKVSVAGPRPRWDPAARLDPFFVNAPELLDVYTKWRTSPALDEYYPEFNVQPINARELKKWGAWQLGAHCKLPPKALKKIVCKNLKNQFLVKVNRLRAMAFD